MKPVDKQYEQLCQDANQLRLAGQIDAEITLRRQLLQLRPQDHRMELGLALALLLQGKYLEAWPHYEARLAAPVRIQVPDSIPRWDGESEIAKLLLVAEQGIGDLVQFLRYIPLLSIVIPSLSIITAPQCVTLLRHSGLFDQIFCFDQSFEPDPDCAWLPFLSLPLVLRLTPNQVLLNGPYLSVDPGRRQIWRERLRAGDQHNVVVGLNWQGNPLAEHGSAKGRSFPLEQLKPIADLGGVSLVSLQKGPGEEQLTHCSFLDRFTSNQDIVNRCWDLVETLEILSACDLVITSDTAVAHLSGGLGLPTWVLLKSIPDWRWGLNGASSFWYPSMRLFRQQQQGKWGQVIDDVANALAFLLTENQLN